MKVCHTYSNYLTGLVISYVKWWSIWQHYNCWICSWRKENDTIYSVQFSDSFFFCTITQIVYLAYIFLWTLVILAELDDILYEWIIVGFIKGLNFKLFKNIVQPFTTSPKRKTLGHIRHFRCQKYNSKLFDNSYGNTQRVWRVCKRFNATLHC